MEFKGSDTRLIDQKDLEEKGIQQEASMSVGCTLQALRLRAGCSLERVHEAAQI